MRVSMTRKLGTTGAVALLALALGCADSSWDAVRKRDTVAAYNQFLREHPNSSFADEAEQRLELRRIKTIPSIQGYETFVSKFPDSALIPELRAFIEPRFFERARAENSPDAYRQFLAMYPNGELYDKAVGNLDYVENVRGRATPSRLQGFVDHHPDSDFSAEAKRTLELLELKRTTNIRRLGVRVDVAPNVLQPERVRRGFVSVVNDAYSRAGIAVKMISSSDLSRDGTDGYMRIDYHEAPASGLFGGTLLSHCRVRLYHNSVDEPIWDRSFEAPADHVLKGAYGRDKTIFSNSRFRFWESFFVPVSTWAASSARVHETTYFEDVKALDVYGDSAALLLERGGVDFLDISTPAAPHVVQRYRRQSDLSHWSGVMMIDDDYTLIYGGDGAEMVYHGGVVPERLAHWELAEIGAVRGASRYDGKTVLVASSKGVFGIRLNQRPLAAHRLLDGEYVGVETMHPYIYVIAPDKVEVASPKHLLRHMTGRRMSLGKQFGARRARLQDGTLFVFGKKEIAEVSLVSPSRPEVVTSIAPETLGIVTDLAFVGGNLFVLGDRGLQVATPSGETVKDSIQVEATRRVEVKERFAFVVGQRKLQVYDLSAYHQPGPSASLPASPAPSE
ncbi:MAG: hypothetical protein JRG76_11230 [Deltaproteobacteria bacterium]|nr:hypothetical protein [Deltaproteobacteria bacterium]